MWYLANPKAMLLILIPLAMILTMLCIVFGIILVIAFLIIDKNDFSQIYFIITIAIASLAFLLGSIIVTKLILNCKWRSIITVSIMSSVVADILIILTILILIITQNLPGQVETLIEKMELKNHLNLQN